MAAGEDWTEAEVEATVQAYLRMLASELRGEHPSRKAYWAPLVESLDGRSKGAVEFKFANVSAALCAIGLPCSDGYKPRANRQGLLDDVLRRVLSAQREILDQLATIAATPLPEEPEGPRDLAMAEVERPADDEASAAATSEPHDRFLPRHVDWAEIESRNRALGLHGERWVVTLEQARLEAAGRADLARGVVHASQVHGDGCGFDVRSFRTDGSPLHVEVKTTRSGRFTPFYVTTREREFSRDGSDSYELHRVFTFASRPRFFRLAGDVAEACRLDPHVWRARP